MPLLRHLVPASHPGGLGSIPGQTSKICNGQCGNGMGFTLNTCFSLPQSLHQFSILEFICLPSRYIGFVMDSVMKQKQEYSVFRCILVFPLKWRSSAVTLRHNYTQDTILGITVARLHTFLSHISCTVTCTMTFPRTTEKLCGLLFLKQVFMGCSNLEALIVYSICTSTIYR